MADSAMAYTCPTCGRQYDPTLFEFGRSIECDCGRRLDIHDGHKIESPRPPRHPPPEERDPERRDR